MYGERDNAGGSFVLCKLTEATMRRPTSRRLGSRRHHMRPAWDNTLNGAEVAGTWASTAYARRLRCYGRDTRGLLLGLAVAFGISLTCHLAAFFAEHERNKMTLQEIVVRAAEEQWKK
jgi:hypothetical protein